MRAGKKIAQIKRAKETEVGLTTIANKVEVGQPIYLMPKERMGKSQNIFELKGADKVSAYAQYQFKPVQRSAHNHIVWGKYDSLPQECNVAIESSPVGKAGTEQYRKFIIGKGFTQQGVGTIRPVPTCSHNLNGLLKDAATSVAYFNTVAFRLIYPTTRPITSPYDFIDVQPIYMNELRKINDDFWAWNPYFNKAEDRNIITPVLRWREDLDPDVIEEHIQLQARYCDEKEVPFGLVFLHFESSPIAPDYPNIKYYAGLQHFLADAAFASGLLKHTKSAGMPAVMFTFVANRAAEGWQSVDTGGDSSQSRAVRQIREFSDPDKNVHSIVNFVQDKEDKPQVDVLNVNEGAKDIKALQEVIERNACMARQIPGVLIGISTAGQLGDKQEVKNIGRLFNATIEDEQKLIEHAFDMLFGRLLPDVSFKISKLQPFDDVEVEAYQYMTNNEIRERILDLPPTEANVNAEIVERITMLSPLLQTKIIDDLTSDERRALIGMEPKPTEQTNESITND